LEVSLSFAQKAVSLSPASAPSGDPSVAFAVPQGLSAVIPVYNEQDNVAAGYEELTEVMQSLSKQFHAAGEAFDYELIYVDDGSSDLTISNIVAASKGDAHVRVIEFRRNFGQTAAMAAGLDAARFSMVVTLDGDLQNDPRELPRMIAMLRDGYDMVAGWRKHRQDAFVSRKLPSVLANWLISKSTRVQLHDYGCTLKVMTHEVAKGIKLYGEMHRFIPALADEMGARIAEIPVNHRSRKFGKSKYGISRTFRVVLDLITVKFLLSFSKRPIHLFGAIGLGSGVLGTALLALLTYQRTFMDMPMGNRPLLALGVMLVIIGLQFLVFGLLGEVLARTYYESQGKKVYMVRRIIGSGTPLVGASGNGTAASMSASAELGGVVARDEVVGLGEQKGTTEQEDERWSRKVAN
jgi:glycosyltransferase involved in cell wall biosynthesis